MEQRYRLSEQFFSIQGEGEFAGTPSLWVRTFGCNLKCPGFPCDTEYSWNGEYKNSYDTYTPEEIYLKLKSLITDEYNPEGLLIHPLTGNDIHLVFTGGEPLLKKYQTMIKEVVDLFCKDNFLVNFTIETNGTQKLTEEFKDWLMYSTTIPFFSISPKLESVSGEKGAVDIENISDILNISDGQIKIVANMSNECEQEVLAITKLINNVLSFSTNTWIMPLGETMEEQLKVAPIVEKYQQMGYKIATRNHTYIWSNSKNR